MSAKHNQRTRAEILAKRQATDQAVATRRLQVQPVESRSKYTPHFGKKQQEKLQRPAWELIAA